MFEVKLWMGGNALFAMSYHEVLSSIELHSVVLYHAAISTSRMAQILTTGTCFRRWDTGLCRVAGVRPLGYDAAVADVWQWFAVWNIGPELIGSGQQLVIYKEPGH